MSEHVEPRPAKSGYKFWLGAVTGGILVGAVWATTSILFPPAVQQEAAPGSATPSSVAAAASESAASRAPSPIPSMDRSPSPSLATSMSPSLAASSSPTAQGVLRELTIGDAQAKAECMGAGFGSQHSWESMSSLQGDEVVHMRRQIQLHGFACRMTGEHATGSVDYVVPQGVTKFTAMVGQSEGSQTSDAVVTFEVIDVTAGKTLETRELPLGEAVDLDVPVADVTRIRLQVTVTKQNGSTELWAAWANPRFS